MADATEKKYHEVRYVDNITKTELKVCCEPGKLEATLAGLDVYPGIGVIVKPISEGAYQSWKWFQEATKNVMKSGPQKVRVFVPGSRYETIINRNSITL